MDMQSIPQMFFARAASRGQRPAQLVKRGGTWQAISWQAMSDNVRHIATGLLTLGLQVGDRVALLASSRAEWVQCDLGIMAAAGITVPVYPSSLPEQVAYILHNAEATLACVDTPAQLEKLLQVRTDLPALRHIVLMEGQPPHPDPGLLSLQELLAFRKRERKSCDGQRRGRRLEVPPGHAGDCAGQDHRGYHRNRTPP
jgi:long-chain acyl-CoA synthetase